ncbi:MAG: DUF2460 domain-containing protein [Acidobacteriia bacterium]|nr:DUF2460 domain-containing protein [Terriglobia bacterium]
MATFPSLKTNAVAQYPATKGLRFQNQTLRFLDGTEQRYRDSAGPLHRWAIRLNQLDEGEMAALETFFVTSEGAFASFAFTDPWDGRVYANCSLETDGLDLTAVAEMSGGTSLTVMENRG